MKTALRSEVVLAASIEETLSILIDGASAAGSPERLGQALRYSVFPGGARLRPRLCLAVACAINPIDLKPALGVAAAIELLHCASLVHDDLPCFDDANERRGKASLHRAFGADIAVLTGDALIVLAFQSVADGASATPHRLGQLIKIISASVGMPYGIVAGQAREREALTPLSQYHLEKTGALFAAATMAGAAAAGASSHEWRTLGETIGLAYQVADDIKDVAASQEQLGKPIGRDAALGRPSAAMELGVDGALDLLDRLIATALDAVPECGGRESLRALIKHQATVSYRLFCRATRHDITKEQMSAVASAVIPHTNLHDRWLKFRDRLLCNPVFVRRISRAPFGSMIARKRARALFDLVAGFVYAQVLHACVSVDLFRRLADGPLDTASIAEAIEVPLEATEQLLLAAVSLGLLEQRHQGCFGLGVLGAAVLANPGVAAMVEHHAMLYADLKDPVGMLRADAGSPELSKYWAYAKCPRPRELNTEQVSAYSKLMDVSVSLVADEVIDAYPIEQYRCLLDVGGGQGGFLKAAAARAPKLKLMLFDLPAVADRARQELQGAGLGQRATTYGGDFYLDPLPRGADIASLIRVIHDHDDEHALMILKAVRAALPDNGILLLAEPMSGTSQAEPVGDAYFAFYLRAMGMGRPRSRQQLENLLHTAGFPYVKLLPTRLPLQTQLLMASPRG